MYRNATHAFLGELSKITREGNIATVRGSEVKEVQSQLIQIANPLERVYLIPRRNNNIFACIAETLWVISGRNDLAFLSYYLPRATDFSDDGIVWRAGYGPRLRNWRSIDQVREVARILNSDRQSRRAVMVIFDPSVDFVESRDIPCNNWLSFLIRENELHMNIAIRSSDIIWGFSGINTFEWSVLQEMLAYWTDSKVGTSNIFVSSLHLYNRHYARAEKIIKSARPKTLYDFGIVPAQFRTPLQQFDGEMQKWFAIEQKIREGGITSVKAIDGLIEDAFMRNCAQMMIIWSLYRADASGSDLVTEVQALPATDFRIAAIEYIARNPKYRNSIQLSESEKVVFDYYKASDNLNDQTSLKSIEDVFVILQDLHYKKTLVYKDSWKKHGEVIGVFSNISRKYDRIESVLVHGSKSTSDETLIDTLSDLAVYATKYLTFLAEEYPKLFEEFLAELDTMHHDVQNYGKTIEGFELVTALLETKQDILCGQDNLTSCEGCFSEITRSYKELESILLGGDWRAPNLRKCYETSNLALASGHCLLLIFQSNPVEYAKFADFIANL